MKREEILKAIEEKYDHLGVPVDAMLEGLLWSTPITYWDYIQTVHQLKSNGVEFLSTPPEAYYKAVPGRLEAFSHELREDIEKLKSLGIMIDADEDGYLLQIFTKPVEDRPTLFFEVIQRMGAKGFGAGNFKALFESIEREQAKRGTL